jgi:RHS repeat-associated protein
MTSRWLSPGQYLIDRLLHLLLIGVLVASAISFVACDERADQPPAPDEAVAQIRQAATVPTGTDVGTLPGTFSMGPSGVASYLIPLWVAEGRNGLTPRLNLVYSSAGGDNPAGHGWALRGGASMIHRCLDNSLRFDRPHQVDFVADSYCLDGQRLVLVGGTEGAAGAEYRTEADTFTKVVVSAVDADAVPMAFDVFTQDGLRHRYGSTSDPTLRVEGVREIWEAPAGGPGARSDAVITLATGLGVERYGWLKGTTSDLFGNALSFRYRHPASARDVGGFQEPLLSAIEYAPVGGVPTRQVKLTYSSRPDALTVRDSYVAGMLFRSTQLLSSIDVQVTAPGATTPASVRFYGLTQVTSPNTARPLLQQVQVCDGNPTVAGRVCKLPTVLTYDPGDNGFRDLATGISDVRQAADSAFWTIQVADMNHDGFDDIVYHALPPGGGNDRHWFMRLGVGNGFTGPIDMHLEENVQPEEAVIADFLGNDGFPDVEVVNASGQYVAYRNNGNNTFSRAGGAGAIDGSDAAGRSLAIADFSGKGQLMLLRTLSNNRWGYKIASAGLVSPLSGDMGCQLGVPADGLNDYPVDIDDDGAVNFLTIANENAGERLSFMTQVAVPAPPPTAGVAPPDLVFNYTQTTILRSRLGDQLRYFFLDHNGDGLADALRIRAGETVPTLAINTGAGFSRPTAQTTLSSTTGNVRVASDAKAVDLVDAGVRLFDYDGDGRQDVLLVDDGHIRSATAAGSATRSTLTVLLTRGQGFQVKALSIPVGLPAAGTDPGGPTLRPAVNNYKQSQLLDVNGDGLSDIVQISPADGTLHLYVRQGNKPDLLVAVEDGMGKKSNVSYLPLGNRTVYDPADACPAPQQCLVRGFWVVSEFRTDNGKNGQNRYSYFYTDNRIDVRGGGVLGFARRTIDDLAHNSTTVEDYDTSSLGEVIAAATSGPATARVYAKLGLLTRREVTTADPGFTRQIVSTFDYDFIPTNGSLSYYARPIQGITIDRETRGGSTTQLSQRVETFSYDPNGDLGLLTGSRVARTTPQGSFVDSTTATLVSDVPRWVLGVPSRTVQTSSATPPGLPAEDVTRTVDYTPNLATGTVDAMVVEPTGSNDDLLRVAFSRNGFGQVTAVTRSDRLGAVRRETTTYDAQSVQPATFTNAAQHVTAVQVDPALGVLQSLTDPNGAVTAYDYDRFGRQRRVSYPGGGGATTVYARDIEPGSVASAHRYVARAVTTFDGGGENRIVTNRLGQLIHREDRNLDGSFSFVDQGFDELGMPGFLTRPAKVGTPAGPSITWAYDRLARLQRRVRPEESVDASETAVTTATRLFSYAGLDTAVVDEFGRTTQSREDGFGRITQTSTVNDAGRPVPTDFVYGAFDLLRVVKRQDGLATQTRTTEMRYDVLGRRKTLQDPNTGIRTFLYNAFGETRQQTDAAGAVTTFERDALGRVTRRADKDGVTTFVWDTALHGKGNLAESTSAFGVKCVYSYDAVGRMSREVTTIDGSAYQIDYAFDGDGRLQKVSYPNVPGFGRLVVANVYEPVAGALSKVQNDTTGKVLWQLKATEVDGQIKEESFGNNVVTDYGHSVATGRLSTIKSTLPGSSTTTLRSDSFAYWADGNLRRRSDLLARQDERFEYDAQDRLKRWLDADAAAKPLSGGWAVNYTVDDLGNLTRRQFVAGTATGGTSQDATFQLTPGTDRVAGGFLGAYAYDANGNQTGRPGGTTVTYTAFDLPRTMTGAQTATFSYDARGLRAKKARSSTDFTIYVGGLFEKRRSGSTTDDVFYVVARGRLVAQVTRREGGAESLLFVHVDRQGSVDTVTDASGKIAERTKRDPFGNRVTNFNQPVLPTTISASTNKVHLGYTGQEQDDELGLINMRNRMYDPRLGRFVTPDPIVPHLFDGPSHNRYSYVLDNPTRYRDPSGLDGETPDCQLWGTTCPTDVNDPNTPPSSPPSPGHHWEYIGNGQWQEECDQPGCQDPGPDTTNIPPLGPTSGGAPGGVGTTSPDGTGAGTTPGSADAGGNGDAPKPADPDPNAAGMAPKPAITPPAKVAPAMAAAAAVAVGRQVGTQSVGAAVAAFLSRAAAGLADAAVWVGRGVAVAGGAAAAGVGAALAITFYAKPVGDEGKGPDAASTGDLVDKARAARDEKAAEVAAGPNRPATVTGGYNTETGEIATGCSGGGKCAEDAVVEALGGDAGKVGFTEAVRPRPGGPPYREVPVCERCQEKYGPEQFPPGTQFK